MNDDNVFEIFFTVQTYPSMKPNQGKTIVIPPQDICCETIIILDFDLVYLSQFTLQHRTN